MLIMEKELTLIEHLAELRKRIIVSLIALCSASVISFSFAPRLLRILKLPAEGLIEKLAFFSPQEAFLVYLRIAFFAGIFFSLPVILYQAWAFILPALDERVRRWGTSFIIFGSFFFISGCLFAYFILIPPALRFLLNFGKEELQAVISASRYISFVVSLILASGLVFQMPLLSFILTKVGVVNPNFLRRRYRYAIVFVFIIAAIITPTVDIFNLLLLALPMIFLYEVSIWISWLAKKI
ncbi:MAG: twin-arginine translocase subunit TatC [Candidatus Omnitrophica bacterium]|nr:twin-arginine translocase subunit TatC [Candidatus Omnitrophota bacterium]MCM8794165.1 twin-arginine translocase subunit TatC [Candidatus Omnitrophota bacterium]